MPPPKRQKLFEGYPTPSNASDMTSAQQSNIKDHRGTGKSKDEAHGIHVSLMWEGFAQFISMQKNPEHDMPHIYLERATELRELLSLRFGGRRGERDLEKQIQEKLEFLGKFSSETLDGRSRTDLTLTTKNGKTSVNIELKAELGKGGKDAVLQNILYYVHTYRNDKDEGLDPMLLISIVGCYYFQVFGAVFGPNNEVLCDPLSDTISLLNVPHDPLELVSKFANVLYALKCTISQLEKYYASPRTNRVPYYHLDTIEYIEPIYRTGRVWKGKDISGDTVVVVKFTLMYNTTVHKYLYECGMAPKLMTDEQLCDGWKVIVMEYIEGKTLHECNSTLKDSQKDAIKVKLKAAVQRMKNKNYVHGDLRLPNIMIKDSEVDSEFPTPIILDFDWAGIDGEVKYPVNLNNVVDWPDTAKSGLPILNSHDMYMVENLFTYCQ